ncbi:MAG TPA: response regulator [Geminicoccaceae bacterium]|nr:response regulator [Geminicoccus sp.]HMU48291.1 response regulator [Geminicoccaceae bacterium]
MAIDKSQPVLIVDDHAPMLRIVRVLLRQLGFEAVDEAADGSEALAMLRERRYGLVISDWNMQPMTGFDLLRRVRADDALKDLPFLMVTAEGRTENVIAAREAGVSGYLMKPFGIESFRAKIGSIGSAA